MATVQVYIDDKDRDRLKSISKTERRSVSQQALLYILKGMGEEDELSNNEH